MTLLVRIENRLECTREDRWSLRKKHNALTYTRMKAERRRRTRLISTLSKMKNEEHETVDKRKRMLVCCWLFCFISFSVLTIVNIFFFSCVCVAFLSSVILHVSWQIFVFNASHTRTHVHTCREYNRVRSTRWQWRARWKETGETLSYLHRVFIWRKTVKHKNKDAVSRPWHMPEWMVLTTLFWQTTEHILISRPCQIHRSKRVGKFQTKRAKSNNGTCVYVCWCGDVV